MNGQAVAIRVLKVAPQFVNRRGPGGRPWTVRPLIEKAFRENPSRDCHDIAKEIGCHWQTVLRIINPLKVRRLKRNLGSALTLGHTYIDEARLKWLAMETEKMLDVLIERAKSGVNVVAASEFARWLAFSGVLDLVIADDSKKLRVKTADLNVTCSDYFRSRGTSVETEDQQIPMVNKKLDLLMKMMAKV